MVEDDEGGLELVEELEVVSGGVVCASASDAIDIKAKAMGTLRMDEPSFRF
ncbi:MAG: hypothetical protein JO208_00120 [Alphaproteobacteria bacterium]|nr:hypothetical protein [Alphaproteobacteria bacterium]